MCEREGGRRSELEGVRREKGREGKKGIDCRRKGEDYIQPMNYVCNV